MKELWTGKDLVLQGSRLVIPTALRKDVLKKLHLAHQGIERTLRRARQLVYWPGLTSDITNTINSCAECQAMLPSPGREPMMSDPPPSRVFEDVSIDIFSYSGNHLFTKQINLFLPSFNAGRHTFYHIQFRQPRGSGPNKMRQRASILVTRILPIHQELGNQASTIKPTLPTVKRTRGGCSESHDKSIAENITQRTA
jgi:hypothetical protein